MGTTSKLEKTCQRVELTHDDKLAVYADRQMRYALAHYRAQKKYQNFLTFLEYWTTTHAAHRFEMNTKKELFGYEPLQPLPSIHDNKNHSVE
jgi:hypothetical protein